MYEYFYNGGGVAVGDVNNDGFDDLYFTSNMGSNALYLNKGKMQFEEVTDKAGVSGRPGPWKTGVTMVDINGDGLMDIYVCYSGNVRPEKRTNQLFVNHGADANGIPQFKEEATKFGLDLSSATTQTYFFDYDKDGDLDAFVLNHNIKALPELNEQGTAMLIKQQDAFSGIRLLKNTKEFFEDVTVQSNLSSSSLTYGLGAGIADVNNDGWTDIYVSNDYNVPDYLYINNGNGTFTDQLGKSMGHTSQFSMGNDVADVNNDALPDIFTLDMLPEDNARQKLLLAPDNYAKFELNVRIGFHYQYMRNMLQLNNGNGTFSEVGQLARISNTDWSWTPLLADYDNDGWKDLFVTNGYLRDYTNLDFIKYMDNFVRQKGRLKREDLLDLVHRIPASNVVNYIFQNRGGYTFKNVTHTWGIDQPSNSNGAAYSDLDNDGDLDLVVNNINEPAFIYRNESTNQFNNHYLKIRLRGAGKNTAGLGAKITVYTNGTKQYLEQMPSRGYQSSVSPVVHVGLGENAIIDSVCIDWLSGKRSIHRAVSSDQLIIVKEYEAKEHELPKNKDHVLAGEINPPFKFVHQKINVNDFKRQPLLINPMSFSGPCMSKADVNGDGLEEVFIGGAKGQAGVLYFQQPNGNFSPGRQPDFEFHKSSDDTDAAFFDANADGFTDLYVCSGGYHDYMADDSQLQDRLYINDGRGNFKIADNALPLMNTSTACARVVDVNKDGHMDIFVGGRVVPGRYPEKPRSYLLINNGKGKYADMTQQLAPSLEHIGMVTDAKWLDLNGDNHEDLILVGEWMPITVFLYENGKFHDKTLDYFDKEFTGWWNTIHVNDFNHDGHDDLVIGNHGLNSQCKVSDAEPGELFYKDFDNNGSVDPIFCLYIQGKSFPYVSRDEMMEQLSMMRQRFPDYKSYSDATLNTIFKPEELNEVGYSKINTLQTVYFQRDKKGRFQEKVLPIAAQVSPVFAITSLDYDKDGHVDLLLCGNTTHGRIRFGKYDANIGVLLKGDGKGGFLSIPPYKSGFNLHGDVRSILHLNGKLLFGINQQEIKAYAFDQIR